VNLSQGLQDDTLLPWRGKREREVRGERERGEERREKVDL